MDIDFKKQMRNNYKNKLGRVMHYLKSGYDGPEKMEQKRFYEAKIKEIEKEICEFAHQELNRLRQTATVNMATIPDFYGVSREGLTMSIEQANYFDDMKQLVKEMGDEARTKSIL